MLKRKMRGLKGFTLIELLAVMAIVAGLAGIVSVSVSGSGQTSRDTQVQEDASSSQKSAGDFFDKQPVTELFDTLTVSVIVGTTTFASIEQKISNQWPEDFITNLYGEVFIISGGTETINSIEFLDSDSNPELATVDNVPAPVTTNSDFSEWTVERGSQTLTLKTGTLSGTLTIAGVDYLFTLDVLTSSGVVTVTVDGTTVGSVHLMEVDDILKGFNAIDWDVLDLGGFVTTVPLSSSAFSDITDTVSYPNYLWLLEKTVEQGGTRTINSRNVAVYALISVEEDATNTGKFNLVFWRVT